MPPTASRRALGRKRKATEALNPAPALEPTTPTNDDRPAGFSRGRILDLPPELLHAALIVPSSVWELGALAGTCRAIRELVEVRASDRRTAWVPAQSASPPPSAGRRRPRGGKTRAIASNVVRVANVPNGPNATSPRGALPPPPSNWTSPRPVSFSFPALATTPCPLPLSGASAPHPVSSPCLRTPRPPPAPAVLVRGVAQAV